MTGPRKWLQILVVLAAAGWLAWTEYYPGGFQESGDHSALVRAIANGTSDVQVTASGEVIKVLPDDNHGSRHQRFLVRLDSGDTILIAHNIDLAPRVPGLRRGDEIRFNGEYEWNDKGGVVHWTHKDPRSRHVHGWLEHEGERYW